MAGPLRKAAGSPAQPQRHDLHGAAGRHHPHGRCHRSAHRLLPPVLDGPESSRQVGIGRGSHRPALDQPPVNPDRPRRSVERHDIGTRRRAGARPVRRGQGDQFGGRLDAGAVRLSPFTKSTRCSVRAGRRSIPGPPTRSADGVVEADRTMPEVSASGDCQIGLARLPAAVLGRSSLADHHTVTAPLCRRHAVKAGYIHHRAGRGPRHRAQRSLTP